MEKKDKLTIIVFTFLVIAIISVVGINYCKNRPLENVDRKIEYIMGYTYDTVLNKGEFLFKKTLELLLNNDVFEYAKGTNEKTTYYSINKINNYKKINNFSIVKNILSENTIKEYMGYKKIIYFEDSYYIVDEDIVDTNYIGSMIDIDYDTNNLVIFKSINYYCESSEFIGLLLEEPTCNYEKKETNFSIDFKDNTFRISNLNDFKQIINP